MSKLKGVKPSAIQKRAKMLFYGSAGVGKTTAAIQFPKPYLFDTEKGAENTQYVKLLEQAGGVIYQSTDFDELVEQVYALLTEEHPYKTLIIDPFTTIYNDLVEKAGRKHGTDFGRHYNEANKAVKHLLNLLLRLDMNVIITSHAKNEYAAGMTVIGQTFDCYKKLDYLFDLVFEIQKRGKDRVALIKKSRIETFPDGEIFPFSYTEVANRYGREVLERDAVAEKLAEPAQVSEIARLIDLMKIPEETTEKWLEKLSASSFNEMRASDIQKIIDQLHQKLTGKAA
jgi:DNA polymerase III delta prime subunit